MASEWAREQMLGFISRIYEATGDKFDPDDLDDNPEALEVFCAQFEAIRDAERARCLKHAMDISSLPELKRRIESGEP